MCGVSACENRQNDAVGNQFSEILLEMRNSTIKLTL